MIENYVPATDKTTGEVVPISLSVYYIADASKDSDQFTYQLTPENPLGPFSGTVDEVKEYLQSITHLYFSFQIYNLIPKRAYPASPCYLWV